MTTLIAFVVSSAFFGTLCGLMTKRQGRGWIGVALGGVLGLIGGPIGGVIAVIICGLIGLPEPAGAPKRGWYPGPSGEDERYWNGRAWADLPPRPVSR